MTEQSEEIRQKDEQTSLGPRPSSPRKFFARIYGHLEEPRSKASDTVGESVYESDSSSDVEVEEVAGRSGPPPVWPPQPPPLPLCPRPMLLQHQQLAFGAGLAAFREYLPRYLFRIVCLSIFWW